MESLTKGFDISYLSVIADNDILEYMQWIIEPMNGGFTIKNVDYGMFLKPSNIRLKDGSDLIGGREPFVWSIFKEPCDGDAIRFVARH